MKLVLCTNILVPLDFAGQCRLAKGLGYEGIEVAPFCLDSMPQHLSRERPREIRRTAEDNGVPVTGIHSVLVGAGEFSITSADPTIRGRTLDLMQRMCELSADLGGTYVVHGSPRQRLLDVSDPDGSRRRGVEAYAKGGEFAADAGIVYLIEPVRPSRTDFINTVGEACQMIDACGYASLKTVVDVCSASEAEDLPVHVLLDKWLPTGHIAHIHLNDASGLGPGQGELEFLRILASLKKNRYAAVAAVEPLVVAPDGHASAARAIGYLQGLLQALN